MKDKSAQYLMSSCRRARCEVCFAIPKVHWSTPVVREDERTGVGIQVATIGTCRNYYCRARAARLATWWPMKPFLVMCGPVDVLYPMNVVYMNGI